MEQATRYTVTLFLAAPGTPLNSGGSSPRGHMYFQTTAGEEAHSYGFAPPRLPTGENPAGVQYAEVVHDDADEHRDPYYSRTLEISEEHYGCLRDFAEEPAEFGFDVDRPATINRCSDFVWAALHYAGLHSQPAPLDGGSNLGEFAVLFNLPEIQCIAAPFPASELNGEQHHPMPEREAEHHRQGDRASDEPPPTPIEVAGTLLDPSHPDHRLFSQLIQKVAELDAAQKRHARSATLVKRNALPQQTLDDDLARLQSTQAALAAANAQVISADAGISATQAQVEEARSAVEAAQAGVDRLQADIDDSQLKAPRTGRVQYRVTQPGEVLGAGGKLLNLVDLTDVYMTFFLPERLAGRVALGSEVRLVIDAVPQYVIPAKVSFVASVAQFTPKTVETASERQKLMFRVRAQISQELLREHLNQVKTGLPGVAWVKLDAKAEWPQNLSVRVPE